MSLFKKTLVLLVAVVTVAATASWLARAPEKVDIVIYGGGFSACAAAIAAATAAPEQEIIMVIPYPEKQLGGIGTLGGQNFLDLRFWQNTFPTKGSLYRWYQKEGRFYNVASLARTLEQEITSQGNVKLLFGREISKVKTSAGKISSLLLGRIQREKDGRLAWREGQNEKLAAKVYIDASESGRLARLAGAAASVGRFDWPAAFLPPGEREKNSSRQQAATLMFKVRGVKVPTTPQITAGWEFVRDHRGSWGLAGGKEIFENDPVVKAFNLKHGPRGFALKPINAAQDGAGSEEWWVNALLIFNVDGRARELDRGTENFPRDMLPGSLTPGEAWSRARDFIDRPEFLAALQRFKVKDNKTGKYYGFHQVELVRDQSGQPVVGKILYLRETIHAVLDPGRITHGTENTNYALGPLACQLAGDGPGQGRDGSLHPYRIGLAHYFMDVNAYHWSDLTLAGDFSWPVTPLARPDWAGRGGQPENPVYLPYKMLLPANLDNLLISGYATGASSLAWSEVRVLPNLAVLGDAAGTAAALAVQKNMPPGSFATPQIEELRDLLRQNNARVDK